VDAAPPPTPAVPAPAPRGPSSGPWAFAVAAVAVVGLVVGGVVYVVHSARSLPTEVIEGGREALRGLRDVAAAFRAGSVTTSFRSDATALRGTTRLQFAELRQLEVFERRDEAAILWGALRLPDVVVEARAPVSYTYFVDLDKAWSFRLQGREVFVQAPLIEWNRPSVDVSALRYQVTTGSYFRDEAQVQERLREELTALAQLRASQHLPLVREAGRRKVEAFVLGWLLKRFSDGPGYRAHVRFAGEPAASASPEAPLLPSPIG
jgi:hypothetical protein